MLSCLLALTLQAGVPDNRFTTAPQVAEPTRLAMTPMLDGKSSVEEWDPFSDGTYFQWQPGQLHFGAVTGTGKTLVATVDLNADGWLVGNDNLEVQVDPAGKITARRLNAKNASGPTWEPFPELALAARATVGAVTELTLIDPGMGVFPTEPGRKVSLRIDATTGESSTEPFLPRSLATVTLAYQRAAAVPAMLKWDVERSGRVVPAGGRTKMRLTFGGDEKVQPSSISMRSEGFAAAETNQVTKPFPTFDKKGRAFVDYETDVRREATSGYRVLRSTVKTADGLEALLQSSYQIAQTVDVELINKKVPASNGVQRQRFSYYIKSNTSGRVDGVTTIRVPEGLKITDGEESPFLIYNSRGGIRKVFELELQPTVKGTYPIVFSFTIGSQTLEQVAYLTIQPVKGKK